MTKDEALKLALEALEIRCGTNADERGPYGAITAIREALAQPEPGGVCVRCGGWVCDPIPELAQPEQEPVAYSYTSRITGAQGFSHHPMPRFIDSESWDIKPLYTQQYTYIAPTHQKPFGWKLVPIEPTNEMLKAMDECSTEGYDERLLAGHASSVYMAAVDVAPTPPQPEQEPNKDGSLCPEFWDWLPKAYNFDGNGAFTKYNMEVAFLAGKQTSQPAQQEPVATLWQHGETGRTRITMPDDITDCDARWFKAADLYTTPPQRKPLTSGEIYTAYITATNQTLRAQDERLAFAFARAIETAHGIKD